MRSHLLGSVMISLQAIHRLLAKLERQRVAAQFTPEALSAAVWRTAETGEMPEELTLAAAVKDIIEV